MPPDFRSQGFRYEVMTEAALILYRDHCQNLIGERMRREYFIFPVCEYRWPMEASAEGIR
jgi:hypothetical protein